MAGSGGNRGRIWRLTAKTLSADGQAIVLLEGRLGHTTANELESAARRLMAEGTRRLVFDLSKVDYLSSPALRVIERLASELSSVDGRLTLRGPSIPVRLALELSGHLNLVIE